MPSFFDEPATSSKKTKAPTDPRKPLETKLAKLLDISTSGKVSTKEARQIQRSVKSLAEGLDADAKARLGVKVKDPSAKELVVRTGGTLLGTVLRNVGRTGQAPMSALAEFSRDYERKGRPILPTLERDQLTAAREGWNLKRNELPTDIAREAGEERVRRGDSPRAFFGKGGDLRTNPLGAPKPLRGAANLTFDLVAGAALDPTTYLTFGTGQIGKQGLRAAEGVLGAERTAVIAKRGLKAISEGERALLAEKLPPKLFAGLDRAQGGLAVRRPALVPTRTRRIGPVELRPLLPKRLGLAPAKTLIPASVMDGPLAPLRRAAGAVNATGAARTTARLFRPREAIRERFGTKVADAFDDARARYQGTYKSNLEDDIATISAAARRANVTTKELEEIIGPALDIGGASVTVPARLQPVVAAFDTVRERLTKAQIDAGVLPEHMAHETGEYLPRVITPLGREFVGAAREKGRQSVLGRLSDPHRQGRTFRPEQPTHEINTEMAGKVGGDLFDPNPARAAVTRSVRANRAIAARGFVDDVLKLTDGAGGALVRPIDDFRKVDPRLGRGGAIFKSGDVTLPPGYVELNIPTVGKFGAPAEIADELGRLMRIGVDDKATGALLKVLDWWMNLWKGYATLPLVGVGFTERNSMGNVIVNWARGVGPGDYAEALRMQRLMSRGKAEGDVLKYLDGEDRAIVDGARKHDAIGEGFFQADLPAETAAQMVPRMLPSSPGEAAGRIGRKLNPLSRDNVVLSSGAALNRAVEQNARLAHYIHIVRETGSPTEAARSVRFHLFDYSDLTHAEQSVAKRFHGFYTFSRKVVPLMVSQLMERPDVFATQQRARMSVAGQAPDPQGMYPGYLAGIGGTPSAFTVRGRQVVLAPDSPLSAASDMLTPLMNLAGELPGAGRVLPRNPEGRNAAIRDLLNNNLVGGLPGAVSTAAQVASGEKFFTGAPIRDRMLAAPVYARPFAGDAMVDGRMQPAISEENQFILEQLLPLLGKFDRLAPQGPNAEDKATRGRISATTGMRTAILGESTQRGEAYRRGDVVSKRLASLRSRGIEPTPKKKADAKKSSSGGSFFER